ncbi:hypothetical protein BOTBODRAFT_405982 [Botryobasidium botryosum FD-172 SS1]|uniref:Uncharacterized protein n=1 Tax=Botryobasidium botryosum (strain FD-172 SS1) TaxID=930990 RepID=A0A067MM46_BOTB1|nr:hypothetical protein BOTBODRAFT_405982 [Botryobasidium botryosum FD-172 SS1]
MITIDYSAFSTLSQAEMSGQSRAVIWLGTGTGTPSNLMDTCSPTTLLNNFHLTASYTMNIRRTFDNSVQSFLGIFQAYDTFGVADVVIYGSNPDPSIDRKPNTSSLLLYQLYDPSAVRIVQDISANSFLHGLSNLGGLYTTANAVFLFVFGFGLVRMLGLDHFSLLQGIKCPGESAEKVTEKQE